MSDIKNVNITIEGAGYCIDKSKNVIINAVLDEESPSSENPGSVCIANLAEYSIMSKSLTLNEFDQSECTILNSHIVNSLDVPELSINDGVLMANFATLGLDDSPSLLDGFFAVSGDGLLDLSYDMLDGTMTIQK